MRHRQAFGLSSAYSGHSIGVVACHELSVLRCANVKPSACHPLTQDIRFDLMACHEGDFRLLKAGGSRIEWYRYGVTRKRVPPRISNSSVPQHEIF